MRNQRKELSMSKAWRHFKTITYHKYLVAKGCFRVGLYRQGILHDLSKYSPEEFLVGVKYFQGNRSPNNAEREALGYSRAWMHHKGRNKHHFEYWNDYDKEGNVIPVPMPDRYIAEMLMDRIAASKVYEGKAYTDASPLAYYRKGKAANSIMHEYTRSVLERMLKLLADKGEDRALRYIRRTLVRNGTMDNIVRKTHKKNKIKKAPFAGGSI